LFLAAVLAACGGKSHNPTVPAAALDPHPAAPAPSPSAERDAAEQHRDTELTDVAPKGTQPAAPQTLTIPARPGEVTLLKPGKGKKQKLALALAAGKQQSESTLAITANVSGMKDVIMPAMNVAFDVEVADVDGTGTAHVKETIASISAGDTKGQTVPSKTLDDQISQLEGLTVETTIDPHGQVGDEHVTFPSDAKLDPESLQQLLPPTAIFPDEAVGVGARWKVVQHGWGPMDATETSTYTLLSNQGGHVKLAVDIAVSGPKQDVSQGDAKVEMTKLEGAGAGKLDASLSSPIAAGTGTMSMEMQMTSADKTIDMKMGATTTTKIK
jgi:hypothetical protein